MDSSWLDFTAVAALGGIVGASELVSRYRDDPWRALGSVPAAFYVALNVIASLVALAIIQYKGWFQPRGTQILMAGISAMAFFRTSLFIVRAGDRDVGVGPSGFLQIYLTATDRNVDRLRAQARSDSVAKIMAGVDYTKAAQSVPQLCLALMQNLSQEDQSALARALARLDAGEGDAAVKARLLGLELINVVGVDVLTAAVKSLGDQIR